MKVQKSISQLIAPFFVAGSLLLLSGCGDSLLDSLNTNEEIVEGGTTVATSIDQAAGMFLSAQGLVHDKEPHQYQYQFNLHIDNYCGYLSLPQNFDGRQASTYYINKDFASGPRSSFFKTATQVLPVIRGAKTLDIEEIGAMASILYCYSAQELVDVYGPFPWWDYKQEKQDPPLTYYSVEDIYDSIFTDIQASINVLLQFEKTTQEHQNVINKILKNDKKDRLCEGNVSNWIRFANSLRLRMAMHISTVAPEKAKEQARLAINGGVLEFGGKNIAYDVTVDGGTNPLAFISSSWQDTRLNASFENLLKRLKSPLLSVWFMQNDKAITDNLGNEKLAEKSDYIGIRSGLATDPRSASNKYLDFSALSTGYNFRPVYLMKVSEVQFLLAEATLRWGEEMTGAPAQLYYENGIICSFVDENIFDANAQDQYILLEKPEEIDYVDYFDSQNNAKGLVTIGVMWDDEDSPEVKLEKIITQKYIANFPMGLEAWTDLRRTGFPKIYPVVDDDGDGSIPEGEIIRRIPYIINDDSDKEDVSSSAVPLLGGPDLQGTRLWWDTGRLF